MDFHATQKLIDQEFEHQPGCLAASTQIRDDNRNLITYLEWRYPTTRTIERIFCFDHLGIDIEVMVTDRRGADGITLEEAYAIYLEVRRKIENGTVTSPYKVIFVENKVVIQYEVDDER